MLTAASVYQIAKESSDKEMAKLHKMVLPMSNYVNRLKK
jgi:hypothetical protein